MIYFHFPILTPVAKTAAEYAECAGEQGPEHFWDYVDGVYRGQRGLSNQSLSDLAATLDIDHDAMDQCVASGRHTATWGSDLAYGRSLGVRGTPTIFVAYVDANGEEVRLQFIGAMGFDSMSEILDSISREIRQRS